MYGSIPAGNDNMLNEELNIENLAERVNKAKRIIEVTILSLDKDMNKNSMKEIRYGFDEELKSLVIDLWKLKERAKKILPNNNNYEVAQKIIYLWENVIYKLLNKLDSKILEWNRKHYSNQLKRIEQICGVPIREESCFGY